MNEGIGLAAKLLDWAWLGVLALVGIVWRANGNELDRQRNHLEDLFKKLDSHAARDEEMFRDTTRNISDGLAATTKQFNDAFGEITQSIHENHSEMLRALPKRKDD